jgi:hypothetical protein
MQDLSLGGGHAVSVEAAKPGKRPAAAGHLPDFIEGPKPGKRPRKKAALERIGGPNYRAAAPASRGRSRPEEGREATFEKKAWRPGQREDRPAGTGARPAQKRFERPSGGQDKPAWGRRPRSEEGPRPRTGQGRTFSDRTAPREFTDRRPEGPGVRREGQRFNKPSLSGKARSFQDRGTRSDERSRPGTGQSRPFGDRTAPRGRIDRRPAGERPSKDSRPAGRPAFGIAGSRPGQRTARPESRGPRPEGRTGWQRDSSSRRPSGESSSRPPMRRSSSGPQGRPQGPRRSGPRPAGGFERPKGPGRRRS